MHSARMLIASKGRSAVSLRRLRNEWTFLQAGLVWQMKLGKAVRTGKQVQGMTWKP